MTLRDDLIQAGADAVDGLAYDTLELRNWGEESVADPYRIVAAACLDAILATLTDRADEWADYPAQADPIVVAHREIIARKLIAALQA